MGDKPNRVIVTRPAQDAARWAEKLAKSGFDAHQLPLIEIGPVADPTNTARLVDAWRELHTYAACLFVSSNAVQYFFQYKPSATQSNKAQLAIHNIAKKPTYTIPSHLRFLAPGPGTAAALLAVGVPAGQIDSPPEQSGQFDSEALWQVVGERDWHKARVLVLRGQASGTSDHAGTGRDWLAEQWLAAGAQVDRLSVYQRSPPIFTDRQMALAQSASRDGSVWLFSSSEALKNLLQYPPWVGQAAADWRVARAIATHPRIAQAVHAAGWGVVRESRPTFADIVNALRSIESVTHE